MGEPAHDDAVLADHLLAIDAEVLPALPRPARHRQAPGNQGPRVLRPARLHRQSAQIDVGALPVHFLARRRRALFRRHVEHALEDRELVPQVAQALGRLRFLEIGEQLADFAQLGGVLRTHCGGDARYRAEEIGEHRHLMPARSLKDESGSARAQHAVADLGHLQARRHASADALQLALRLELSDELPKVAVAHRAAVIRRSAAISAKSSRRGSRPRTL